MGVILTPQCQLTLITTRNKAHSMENTMSYRYGRQPRKSSVNKIENKMMISLQANGEDVRSINDWAAFATQQGLRNGQAGARYYAKQNGQSVIIWGDGHVTQFVFDSNTGQKTRIRFGKEEAARKAKEAANVVSMPQAGRSMPKLSKSGW